MVSSEPKSSASKTWRISISASPSWGLGQRLTHSTASSMDLTCHSQKPAISSLVSLKGPSITVRSAPENRTRLPFELGLEPVGGKQHAGFHQLFVELPHFGKQLLLRHNTCLGVLVGLDHHHDPHCYFSFSVEINLTSTLTSNDRQSDRQVNNLFQ